VSLAVVEGVVLFLAVCGSILAWGHLLVVDWIDVVQVLWQAAAVSFCCIVAFYYNDLYDLQVVRSFSLFASRLLQSFGVALIFLAGFYTLFPDTQIAGGPFFSSLLVSAGLLVPLRAIGYFFMRHRAFADRVLILGTGPLAMRLVREIDIRPNFRYALAGVADDGGTASAGAALPCPVLGPLERLDKIIEEVKPDRIIVALSERRGRMPVGQLLECGSQGILVEDGLRTYEYFTGKLPIESLSPSFLIFSGEFRKSRLQLGGRRVASVIAGALGLLLAAPLMALIAVAIKLDSRGPVLYIDERAGLGGRPFRLVKFRTMHPSSREMMAGSVWARDDSTRITRVGHWIRRLRLDELPQFWNVLKGDMDLVGPRPEIMANVQTMSEQIPYYSLRHSVRPGLTGWAQTRFGYSVSLEQVTEKMRYDLFYIKHMSFWLDLRVLVDTVKIMLFGRGAR
jgi:exopolysaccharide biosynthesis polyprenyl glycosylphosphotransferase